MPSVALKLELYQQKDQGIFQLPATAVPCSWTISFMSRWPERCWQPGLTELLPETPSVAMCVLFCELFTVFGISMLISPDSAC